MYLLRLTMLRVWAGMALVGFVAEALLSIAFASTSQSRPEERMIEETVVDPSVAPAATRDLQLTRQND
jgi:hypothetical protein